MSLITKAISAVAAKTLRLFDPDFGRIMGGDATTYAGRTVTVDSAMQLSTAFACVRIISQTWGTLPVEVKIWDGRQMVPSRDHPLYALLHDTPNADMSAVEFWSAMGVSLMTWGNAYAEIDRVFGRPVAITPLRPDRITMRRLDSGAMVYRSADRPGGREIPEDNILHIKGVTTDGLQGMSPIAQARHSLGLAAAAEETAGKLFANGMRSGGYIKAPQILTKDQRDQAEDLLGKFRGAHNAGKTPILEGGWSYESLTMPPQEAELLATRAFGVEEICRWYGVPPFMVGHTEKSTSWGTGIEQQMLAFHTLTLRPVLKNAEHAIRRRLLAPAERSRVEVDFNVEGLLRSDSQGRAIYLKTMVQSGIYTPNEARAYEGKTPMPGGDDLLVQSQNVPLSMIGKLSSQQKALPAPEATV